MLEADHAFPLWVVLLPFLPKELQRLIVDGLILRGLALVEALEDNRDEEVEDDHLEDQLEADEEPVAEDASAAIQP